MSLVLREKPFITKLKNMVYKHFGIKVCLLVAILAATAFLFSWSLMQDHLIVAKFTFAILFFLQSILLINFIKSNNRKLGRFLELIKNEDFIQRFSKIEKEASSIELNLLYNEIIESFEQIKIEKESEYNYFQNIIENIGTGIISFSDNGKVELINQAAKDLLKIGLLKEINDLDKVFNGFPNELIKLKTGQQKVIKFFIDSELIMLSVKATIFIIRKKTFRLISLQNITNELEEEEIDAWQKLIRVLTHEIMNSVSPVKSLTSTIIKLFQINGEPKKAKEISDSTIENSLTGLHAIDKRNQGLLKFVETYRSLTKIPKPNFEEFKVEDVFTTIKLLMNEEIKRKKIKLSTNIKPENLKLKADEKLISQVLINLVKNACEAITENGGIKLEAFMNTDNGVLIRITDNGKGIPKDILEKIFIPFFTTRKNGSGIGLSLSRQIMRMHKGNISASSKEDEGSVFTLKF